jgi:hypothetical protein
MIFNDFYDFMTLEFLAMNLMNAGDLCCGTVLEYVPSVGPDMGWHRGDIDTEGTTTLPSDQTPAVKHCGKNRLIPQAFR